MIEEDATTLFQILSNAKYYLREVIKNDSFSGNYLFFVFENYYISTNNLMEVTIKVTVTVTVTVFD